MDPQIEPCVSAPAGGGDSPSISDSNSPPPLKLALLFETPRPNWPKENRDSLPPELRPYWKHCGVRERSQTKPIQAKLTIKNLNTKT